MATPPALSIQLPSFAAEEPESWQGLLSLARAADDAGVDRVFVSDHVVFGEHLEAYGRPELGGVEGGRQPTGPDGSWLEPLTVLTAVAAVTGRVRLATGILLAALRRPVVLAKTAATLDALSDGRLDLGVGIGWQREEYEAAGLDFARRGRLLDETLAVCRTLWRDSSASYHSPTLAFDRIHQMPKPRQAGGVPIWVSGRLNERVLERIVRYGQGWIPWATGAAELGPAVARIRRELEASGRDPSGFAVAGTLPIARDDEGRPAPIRTMARLPELVAAGVTDFRAHLPIPGDPDEARDYLAGWVTAFRDAVS